MGETPPVHDTHTRQEFTMMYYVPCSYLGCTNEIGFTYKPNRKVAECYKHTYTAPIRITRKHTTTTLRTYRYLTPIIRHRQGCAPNTYCPCTFINRMNVEAHKLNGCSQLITIGR